MIGNAGQLREYYSEEYRKLLLTFYNKRVFSASGLGVYSASLNKLSDIIAMCGLNEGENDEVIDNSTVFDLASLTKPLVTLLCILYLIDREVLSWHEPLDSLLNRSLSSSFAKVDLSNLLDHSSGLAPHRNYWKELIKDRVSDRKERLLDNILRECPDTGCNKVHQYSDLGYMLLGFAVEEKTGKRLDLFWHEIVSKPLGIDKKLFFPAMADHTEINDYASTGYCPWSGEKLKGIVHDDNCRSMGGICGHAGLFGTVSAVTSMCREMLRLYKGETTKLPISRKTFLTACQRVENSDWTAGFHLPSRKNSSSGRYLSPTSIGHLGFTGVSFWIDLPRELIVVLLTNRVVMGDDQRGIREMRPFVHDHIVESIYGPKAP